MVLGVFSEPRNPSLLPPWEPGGLLSQGQSPGQVPGFWCPLVGKEHKPLDPAGDSPAPAAANDGCHQGLPGVGTLTPNLL